MQADSILNQSIASNCLPLQPIGPDFAGILFILRSLSASSLIDFILVSCLYFIFCLSKSLVAVSYSIYSQICLPVSNRWSADREPAPVAVSAEQPRPVEPMSVDSMRLRGGGEGEAVCCGVCAGLCCFECCECCC